MFPLLLATTLNFTPAHLEPRPAYEICDEMSHELEQAVDFKIISSDQAAEIVVRCLINYSSGPNPHHIDEV